jgi:hypothetical protein
MREITKQQKDKNGEILNKFEKRQEKQKEAKINIFDKR